MPPSYHRHGSRAILVWLGSLPFVLEGIGCHPLQTIFSLLCTTWLLLGIDQIAIEVEQPLDVLPLHVFASSMANDVLSVLESWRAMPPLRAAGGGDAMDGAMDDAQLGLPSARASDVSSADEDLQSLDDRLTQHRNGVHSEPAAKKDQ